MFEMTSEPKTRVCIPIHESTISALRLAAEDACRVADIIELRVDALNHDELRDADLSDLIRNLPRPVILTFRPSDQGGYRELNLSERLKFWSRHRQSPAAFFDLEKDLVSELVTHDLDQQPDWTRVICSYHDFNGIPSDLNELYDQLAFTPARILKIAIKANDIVDSVQLFQLLDRAGNEDRELIALAMGEDGMITRILGPSLGSFVTYATSEGKSGTAAGQLLASELKDIYRIQEITNETMITGLVGLPVLHSVSPHMHNAAFEANKVNGVYLPFHVQDLQAFFRVMVNPRTRDTRWNLRGLSITAPHKTEVLNCLDWVDPIATQIGAVNTVVVEDEQLLGYNTDADGFLEPLIENLGSLSGMSAAVIGAGGAANAAVFALQQQGVKVTLYARDLTKATSLGERFNVPCQSLVSADFKDQDLVINTTPLGSFGERINETPAVASQLQARSFICDLVYNPRETRFMREGRAAGCKVLGGLDMLVAQARMQFKRWTNTNVSSELMYTAGSSALTKIFSEKL
jgi:3-dehydroquinate dehydratase/shikimate dehydrogenase